MRRLLMLLALVTGLGSATGCVVHDRRVASANRCRNGVYIEGHYGPRGHWHPGHWRCPGEVERVDIY
jgi:hypothetical protein